ncbi:hypothetical protein PUNSTDRAFT_44717 [Punctularia strigosozonata HHB-11173 SS5]|uniref:uncharacterized protein n=1 Tax=Punctularia strigosozonata (strain HHB-11173) TaxID=741275 RepID=UPI000441666C|nr:uncharacterized protein PUNSTDRAFT_44717 [Punctularia strigosozonata HHB-11173 SS5]EIN09358.1 hypothetical protein PUNSTDRAFT_44717 [Punctularia strigosozonata HHB-11173 SS5]
MPPYTVLVRILDGNQASFCSRRSTIVKTETRRSIDADSKTLLQFLYESASDTAKYVALHTWRILGSKFYERTESSSFMMLTRGRFFAGLNMANDYASSRNLECYWYEIWDRTLNVLAMSMNDYNVLVCPQCTVERLEGTLDKNGAPLPAQRRSPDFGVEVRRFSHSRQALVSEPVLLAEVKRPSKPPGPNRSHDIAEDMKRMHKQVKQQAHLSFDYYPAANDIHVLCCVGSAFSLLHFKRSDMSPQVVVRRYTRLHPAPEPNPVEEKPQLTTSLYSKVYELLGPQGDQFSTEFMQIIQYILLQRGKTLQLQGDWFTPDPLLSQRWIASNQREQEYQGRAPISPVNWRRRRLERRMRRERGKRVVLVRRFTQVHAVLGDLPAHISRSLSINSVMRRSTKEYLAHGAQRRALYAMALARKRKLPAAAEGLNDDTFGSAAEVDRFPFALVASGAPPATTASATSSTSTSQPSTVRRAALTRAGLDTVTEFFAPFRTGKHELLAQEG